MLRCSDPRSFLVFLAALATSPLAAQTRTVYVPVVSVTRADTTLPRLQTKSFLTRLDFFNASATFQGARVSATWGPCGPGSLVYDPLPIPPGGTVSLGAPQTFNCPGDYVGIAAVPVPAGVEVSAALQRLLGFSCDATCPGNGPGTASISTGELPMPVFPDLVPAGREALSGSVPLYNEAAYPACGLAGRLYPRRVNITIFNAGAEAATILVQATAGAGTVFDRIYRVLPGRVAQFNGLPLGEPQLCRPDGAPAVSRVFFRATADQPSVAWVSTTFDTDLADSVRYAFFPLMPPSPAPPGPFVVRGTVTDAATHAGIRVAVAKLINFDHQPISYVEAFTDATGRFRFDTPYCGTCFVTADHPDYYGGAQAFAGTTAPEVVVDFSFTHR